MQIALNIETTTPADAMVVERIASDCVYSFTHGNTNCSRIYTIYGEPADLRYVFNKLIELQGFKG